MENGDKDPEGASYNRASTQEDPSVKVNEGFTERERRPQEEVQQSEKPIVSQRIINLKRDLRTLVTNIQITADAKELMRKTELEEARRLRLERLENDVKSSQEKFEEISRGWSVAKQRVIPQDLQKALNEQQELCAALIEDKKKLINDLQQELKVRDDRYVKNLRRQAEELDLMMERMEDQIKTLTKAYREELAQMESVYEQECEILLTREKSEWEANIKELVDKELEWLAQRKKRVEDYEVGIHNVMLYNTNMYSLGQMEQNAKFQALGREQQQKKATTILTKLKHIQKEDEGAGNHFNLGHMKRRIISLQAEMKTLLTKYKSQDKQLTHLSKECKRSVEDSEQMQKKIVRLSATDVRRLNDMQLIIEAEMKELVERVLLVDSLICKQVLGLHWERPPTPFMELSGPPTPKKQSSIPGCQATSHLFQTGQVLEGDQMEASGGPIMEADTQSTSMEMSKKGRVQNESSAKVEEEQVSVETLEKVKELLCDEVGFLLEDKFLGLLALLEKKDQNTLKLIQLLNSLGIDDEDFPQLVNFLIKYRHQQTEDDCVESGESSDKADEVETKSATLNSDLIDPNHVVPALKCFLEQLTRSRERSAHQRHSVPNVEARDASEDEAYWKGFSNLISENKLKLWEAAETRLQQYHEVLTGMSELVPETQSLKRQNEELRRLLQQTLTQ